MGVGSTPEHVMDGWMDGCVVRDMERLEAMDVEGRDDDAKEERRIHGHALTPPLPFSTWARVDMHLEIHTKSIGIPRPSVEFGGERCNASIPSFHS